VSGFSRTFAFVGRRHLMPACGRGRCGVTPVHERSAVFGWPPTCGYADKNCLKSNDAIPRREFVPRDP
jgi:hypothetical protein